LRTSYQPPEYVPSQKFLDLTMPWNGLGSARLGVLIPIMPAAVPYQQAPFFLKFADEVNTLHSTASSAMLRMP
jgi:hypothetical protein